ncbi:MAG: glycosyltransferase [Bacillota bacterium]
MRGTVYLIALTLNQRLITGKDENQLIIACLSMHSSPLGKPGTKDTGGMSTYLRELAGALGKQGHRVDLFTRRDSRTVQPAVEFAINARLVSVCAGPIATAKADLYKYAAPFARNIERFRQVENLSYDLVFSHYWLSALAGRELGSYWGVPHLVMFHTLGAVKNASGSGESEPARRIESEKVIARHCRRVIVAAEREKEALLRYYDLEPGKIAVIPCGVNLELFQPAAPAAARGAISPGGHAKIVLYVGRIEPVKGLELLIRAAGRLCEAHDFRLIVAGGDSYSRPAVETYRRLAGELGIADRVDFIGPVEHEKLPLYYSAAAVTVIPSHYESFGLTALESLACGTPVAAADVGDLRTIIRQGETGLVIGKRAPEELAAGIAALIERPDKPVQACRDSVLNFSWPAIARQLMQAIRDLAPL